jgi:hypothetical protein
MCECATLSASPAGTPRLMRSFVFIVHCFSLGVFSERNKSANKNFPAIGSTDLAP